MQILKTIEAVKDFIKNIKKQNKTIALVPTMGALHEGHLELGRKAKEVADFVIYSIFVNPTQFGPNEDFEKYPRTFAEDSKKLSELGVDAIFLPTKEIIYPKNYKTYVKVEDFSALLCGKTRINHFRGVTTIVLKLFNITEADYAFFGKKDRQQLIILKKMAEDLNLNIKIKSIEIVREKDGLAKSSRNTYLSEAERKKSPMIFKTLTFIKENLANYQSPEQIINYVQEVFAKEAAAKLEYVEIRDFETLANVSEFKENRKMVLFIAVWFGKTRLIDNIDLVK